MRPAEEMLCVAARGGYEFFRLHVYMAREDPGNDGEEFGFVSALLCGLCIRVAG